MLNELFPRRSTRFLTLPLLGPVADDFDTWSSTQGYRRSTRRRWARALIRIDRDLRRHGLRSGGTWRQADLDACWMRYRQGDPDTAGTIHALRRFLQARARLAVTPPTVTRVGTLAKSYGVALEDLRGLAPATVRQHVITAAQFLTHLDYELRPEHLAALTASDIEAFVCGVGRRLSRASLQHTVAPLRGFLRFLASSGLIRSGFDRQIDTPRVYRQEQLPRSLPWPTVRRLLDSIDRRTRLGLRDYTMLFLIATYGLRACEIVALTLDAIDWRGRRLHVPRRKTGIPVVLPLTDAAGTVLLRYLRRGRPASPQRELFLRERAPAGILKPTAVSEVFQHAVRRSGLPIAFHGPHCLRHSYAVSLLRRGVGLKTLGDLLGHRTAESTCAYLRLATDDLRDVALTVPPRRRRGPAMSAPAGDSALSVAITRYLALKTALGRRDALERRVFETLLAFLQTLTDSPVDLTSETFTTWAQTLQRLTPTVRRNHLRFVRNLCLYRRRTEPACFVPDLALFPAPHQPRAPYIFTEREIAQLIRATATLPSTPQCPLRGHVFRLAVILLYTTGLRRGELLRLTWADYAHDEQVLLIRETKFHKSRVVPLSPATAREVDRYLQVWRHQHLSVSATTPLLAHGVTSLRGYTGVGLGAGFRQLLTTTGIRTPEGRWPRIHDLRHTFAVHALARWYQTGADVQAKLPLLATYMGHVSIVSTAYYLPFVEPLRALATARFAQHCGALLHASAGPREGPR